MIVGAISKMPDKIIITYMNDLLILTQGEN